MTANVLAQGNDAARDIPQGRSMYRTRLNVEFLTRSQAPHGNHDLFRRELPAMADNCHGTHRFRDRFHTAQSAPCRSRDLPPPPPQTVSSWLIEPHPQFDSRIDMEDVQRTNVSRRGDNAFA